jgi:hypothetical protein
MMTRRHAIAATGGLVAAVAGAAAQTVPAARSNGTMEIKRSGSQPSRKGPAEYFTGAVRVDPLFQAGDPPRVSGGQVTFEPGARTAWHTHPLGQTLLITSAADDGFKQWKIPGLLHLGKRAVTGFVGHRSFPIAGMTAVRALGPSQSEEFGLRRSARKGARSA